MKNVHHITEILNIVKIGEYFIFKKFKNVKNFLYTKKIKQKIQK